MNITYPPIIWQSTAKRHVVNPNFDINKELEDYAAVMQFPPADRLRWVELDRYLEMGVVPSWKDKTVVAGIKEGSWAHNYLMVGDKLLKVKLIQSNPTSRTARKRQKKERNEVKKRVKENGWAFFNGWYGTDGDYKIVVLRNGSEIEFTKYEQRIKIKRFFWE